MFVQSFFVEGVNLLLTFKGLIVNINLPYVIYYLALVIKSLIILILQIPIISIVKLQFGQDFAPGLFFLPLSITLLSFLGIVIAKIVSILGIISRDLAHLMPSIITILTLVTPILFPISLLSNAKWIYEFNPMYYLISIIRDPLMGIIPNENHFKVCLLILIILYFCSLVLENKLQKKIVPMI
jgi:ABC-type polysaccharide/polyol phosphate export permease